MVHRKILGALTGILFFSQLIYAQSSSMMINPPFEQMGQEIAEYLKPLAAINVKVGVRSVDQSGDTLKFYFNNLMSDYPFRENTVTDIYDIARKYYPNNKIQIYTNGSLIEELQSRLYRTPANNKRARVKKQEKKQAPVLIADLSRPYDITEGLQNRHLAVWQSHGYYYEQKLQRWEWQRARIFQTVEDLYTQSYVVPFLVPMLENAGANVLLPRERDSQIHEVIVDNDVTFGGYTETAGTQGWRTGDSLGFAHTKESYLFGENPFRMGTYRSAGSLSLQDMKGKNGKKESMAQWIPTIPQTGEYAVYVSYKTLPNSTDAAYYTVKYKGGEREFKVNQQMGGGTWIYLGTFLFEEGSTWQGVYLTNLNKQLKSSKEQYVVSADAVKFGGGMGNIARKPSDNGTSENVKSSSNEAPAVQQIPYEVEAEVSGYPRFTEGSRYWLQWAGFADSVYSYTKNMNDYNDDYVSRGRWVNTIAGGSKMNPEYRGLNIPVDMAFAFHSDAGTFLTDSIVGTLSIYTKISNDSDKYPTGESRMQGRELADIVQTQIVDDIRAQFEPKWSRRGLWDRSYSESRSPNVPAMLLELLSHQNFADMKYGLDPAFRFTVSRAIYKGILKFLSTKDGVPYVVQPLPVKNFAAVLDPAEGVNKVRLTWTPVVDTLEPTAQAKRYVVYTRINENGFDNGVVVDKPYAVMPVETNKIYSFKVAALNEGGASFPSEILSVGISEGSFAKNKTVLVVNGFNRVSGPASFQSKDSTLAGFYDGKDHGVPYIKDISYIGSQHEFRRAIPWMDDDAAGFGASYANYEDKVIAGNIFDYPYVHGKAFMKLGYSFVSASTGAVVAARADSAAAVKYGKLSIYDYPVVDFIMGKQAQTKVGRDEMLVKNEVFPVELQKAIAAYCNAGGNVLISGAYVSSDLWDSYRVTKAGQDFAMNVLGYKWMTHYASTDGIVKSVANPYGFTGRFSFYNELNDKVYAVESPDAMVPAAPGAYTIFRYSDNNISAGVAYKSNYKVVTLGFPIETLRSQGQIDEIIGEVVTFFEGK